MKLERRDKFFGDASVQLIDYIKQANAWESSNVYFLQILNKLNCSMYNILKLLYWWEDPLIMQKTSKPDNLKLNYETGIKWWVLVPFNEIKGTSSSQNFTHSF